jgi:hypothetical protein
MRLPGSEISRAPSKNLSGTDQETGTWDGCLTPTKEREQATLPDLSIYLTGPIFAESEAVSSEQDCSSYVNSQVGKGGLPPLFCAEDTSAQSHSLTTFPYTVVAAAV